MTQLTGFFEDHRGSETPEQTHDNRHQYQESRDGAEFKPSFRTVWVRYSISSDEGEGEGL
jgi:hypothetical protein